MQTHNNMQHISPHMCNTSYKREPLPSVGSILVTLLGFLGGALVLVWIGATH